jgi:putrescine aminotransferase
MKHTTDSKITEKSLANVDSELYEYYNEFVSSTYPAFLKKFGLLRTSSKAEGANITDSSGKTYIDCVGGYGLFNIGHNHPTIIKDMISQLNKKQLFTKPLISEIQVRLAKVLSEIAPGDLYCSFICNSGSEAIDNAIKLARLKSGRKQIITADNSFHGYTFGALSATGIHSFKRPFGPLVPEIIHVPFGDAEALEKAISPDTAAVLLEPIQHEAGIYVPLEDYFPSVRRLCDDNGIVLILDEIKTGFGKTGYMFACETLEIVPDILVVGKSLGGGMIPIGALIAKKSLWKRFSLSFPMSASSFAGNTLACRAALTTIKILQQDNLLQDCIEKGELIIKELNELIGKYPDILVGVKGKGLLLGLETINSKKAFLLSKEMINQGVIALPAYGDQSTIMIEPPIVISFEQIRTVLGTIDTACEKINTIEKVV